MVFLSLADQRFIQSGHLLLGLQFRRLERTCKRLPGAGQGGEGEKGQAEPLRDTVLSLLEKRNSPRGLGSDMAPDQVAVVR